MRRRREGAPADPLGARGEALAAAWLAARGYRCLERNLRTRLGEIDLLVRRRRLLVAVEVKTRTHHPAPERLLADADLERLTRAVRALAPHLRPRPARVRVDVVGIHWPRGGEPRVLHLPGPESALGAADPAGPSG